MNAAKVQAPTKQIIETAEAHKSADADCGRSWKCQCGACRIVRDWKGIAGNVAK